MLHTAHKGSTVRHLLIEGDDPVAMTLSRLDNGVRAVVDKGTHDEMYQKAMSLIEEWGEREGFEYRSHGGPPAWESLRDTIALTKLMGHTTLYDATNSRFPVPIPLDHWQGCKDKNRDDYEYAYTETMIEARPRVTAKHGVNAPPATTKDRVDWLRSVVKIRQKLGPELKFLLD